MAPAHTLAAAEVAQWILHAGRRPFLPVGALAALDVSARALAVVIDRAAAADALLVLPERGPGHACLIRADVVVELLTWLHENRARQLVELALALAERGACIRPN